MKYHLSVLIGYIIARVLLFEYVYRTVLLTDSNKVEAILIANTVIIFIGAIVNFSINILWTWKFKTNEDIIEKSIEDYEN